MLERKLHFISGTFTQEINEVIRQQLPEYKNRVFYGNIVSVSNDEYSFILECAYEKLIISHNGAVKLEPDNVSLDELVDKSDLVKVYADGEGSLRVERVKEEISEDEKRDTILREYDKYFADIDIPFEFLPYMASLEPYVDYKPGATNAKYVFGVNVRLMANEDTPKPFMVSSCKNYSSESVLSEVSQEYNIPSFIEKFKIKGIKLECTKNENEIEIVNYSVENSPYHNSDECLDKPVLTSFLNGKEDKSGKSSFLSSNLKALEIGTEKPVFIKILFFDQELKGSSFEYLSNSIIISDNEEVFKEIEKRELRLLDFTLTKIKAKRLQELEKAKTKEAIKSAKAAIMSRNMSHNLGSHVMAYLKQKLSSVTEILRADNDVLSSLYPERYHGDTVNDVEMPFLVGLGRFIGYLQERQDYIATISTDYIPYCAPVNLKDAIYDELNPDLRYMRHNDKDNHNRPFNILLNYIAKSEGLSRENMGSDKNGNKFLTHDDILFGFAKYDGSNIPHIFGLNNRTGSDDPALSLMRGINFNLPGGLVGRQAIFSIFENLIRNAAKHGQSSNGGNLEFTLDVIDGLKLRQDLTGLYEKRICDEKWRNLYKSSIDIDDLYILSITDNRNSDNALLEKIRLALYENFVDSDGKMTTTNKGIKEIRISAAWLRGDTEESNYLEYEDAEDYNKKAPLVAVERDEEGHLRYLICIKKNHMVAVIKEGMDQKDIDFFDSFSENINDTCDWTLYKDCESFIKEKRKGFSYIVVANDSILKKIRPETSNRVCIWSASDKDRELLNTETDIYSKNDKTLNKIVRLFTEIGKDSPTIYIYDDKTDGSPTSNNCFDKISVFPSPIDSETAQFVYRKHHSTEEEFKKYLEAKKEGLYKNIIFIEGITGDNSSDRLVRREKLDERWYCSHLYAMKKKVAIIDERLFRIIHNVDEKRFVTGYSFISEKINQLKTCADIAKVKDEIWDSYVLSYEDCECMDSKYNKEELISFLTPYAKKFNNVYTKYHNSVVYKEKGIDAFTAIPDENGDIAIVGCVKSECSEECPINNTFGKIAFFTKKNGRIELNFCNEQFLHKFDYISVHQGILDKIYEFYHIKDNSKENNKAKFDVTVQINKLSSITAQYDEFLPGFIIHSGRAKPSVEEMPQKLPFIQYAAIENAVKDCKYSLVELLDFAQYE